MILEVLPRPFNSHFAIRSNDVVRATSYPKQFDYCSFRGWNKSLRHQSIQEDEKTSQRSFTFRSLLNGWLQCRNASLKPSTASCPTRQTWNAWSYQWISGWYVLRNSSSEISVPKDFSKLVYHAVTAFSTRACRSGLIDDVVKVIVLIGANVMRCYPGYASMTARKRRNSFMCNFLLCFFCFVALYQPQCLQTRILILIDGRANQ